MSQPRKRFIRGYALVLSILLAAVGVGLIVHSIVAKSVDTDGDIEFTGRDRSDQVCTSSSTFVAMPGTAVTFNQAVVDNPTAILFTGEFSTDGSTGELRIRYLLDGAVQEGPGGAEGYRFAVGPSPLITTLNFLGANQHGGTLTATLQWKKVSGTAGNICVAARSMVVFHR